MKKILVGIGHKAKQGKSVVSSTLEEKATRQGVKVGRYSFGQEVLEYCQKQKLIDPGKVRGDLNPIELQILQNQGYAQRYTDQDVWIKLLHAKISTSSEKLILIDGIRYINECLYIREHNGYLVKIERFTESGIPWFSPDRDRFHISEVELDSWPLWDFRLMNTRDEWWLRGQALALYDYIIDREEKC